MRIGRSLGIGVLVLLVIVVGAVIYVASSLDSIVAAAIEKYGSQATQTPVRVSAVNIDLKSGQGSISELSVANPDGFSAPHAFTLGGISTNIDLNSITKDPIVIQEINVQSPRVVYEINKAGKSNIAALQDNLAESGGSGDSAAKTDAGGGPRLVIRRLVIDSGQIDAKVAALPQKDMSAKLPRIELTNIGEGQGGATASQVAEQVVSALLARVGPAVGGLGLDRYLGKSVDQLKDDLGAGVKEKAADSLGGAAGESKEKLKGLLGK
jgi:uncharacterized protein involved in outer membrane biogenesis